MKIIIRLNAELEGKLVFNYRLREKLDKDGEPCEPLRLSRMVRKVYDSLVAGAGDAARTDGQMPNCPFWITMGFKNYHGDRLETSIDYDFNAHCSASMIAAGMRLYNQLKETFSI